MRSPLASLGVSLANLVLAAAVTACAGGKQAPDPNTPAAANATADRDGAGAEADATESNGAIGGEQRETPERAGTNTTTQLGAGGDLQGAKLSESLHTVTETKGEGGPKSTHGQSAGEPGRRAEDIRVIVMARRDEARACYDKGLAAHPSIEGNLDVKWVIDPQGNVTDASVDTSKSDILEPSVGQCVIDVIKKIKFAPSPKGYETRAHYPFDFHPKTYSNKK